MTKLAIIPFTVLLQTIFYAKTFSFGIKASLIVLLMARRPSCCTPLPEEVA